MKKVYPNDYKNARDVLTEESVTKLQSIHTGLVWIPAVNRQYQKSNENEERDIRIVGLYADGKSTREIAKEVFLCMDRVRRIIKKGVINGSQREDR